MPEGDTIFRAARRLHAALAGQTVTRFESVFPALTRVDVDRPLRGRVVDSVTARGKHLLMMFSGDLILHTHLRMNGSWQIYQPGERSRRSMQHTRIVLETDRAIAVAFNLTIAEFLTAKSMARHPQLRALGPDLLDPTFDAVESLRRLRSCDTAPIGEALLNQRAVAGVGNVLKSEILFVAGVNPFATVEQLADTELERILAVSVKLLSMNVPPEEQAGRSMVFGRRTRNSLDPSARLWVYGRAGRPCRKCGRPIQQRKTGIDARVTYWCPGCQPARPVTSAAVF